MKSVPFVELQREFPQVENILKMYALSNPDDPVDLDLFATQVSLELDNSATARNSYINLMSNTPLSHTDAGQSLINKCMPKYVAALEVAKKNLRGNQAVADFLLPISSWELALIATQIILNTANTNVTYTKTCKTIGQAIVKHLAFVKFRGEHPGLLRHILDGLLGFSHTHRSKVLNRYFMRFESNVPLSEPNKVYVGLKLAEVFIMTTGLVEPRIVNGFRSPYMLCFTSIAEEFLTRTKERFSLMTSISEPMLVPPMNWIGMEQGGYLTNGSLRQDPFVKTNRLSRSMMDEGAMAGMFKAANILNHTAWRINPFIYRWVREAESFDALMDFMPKINGHKPPPKPWRDSEVPDPDVLQAWKLEAAMSYKLDYMERTARIQYHRRMGVAQKYQDAERFFFGWNCDFRGRFNALQNWLHPQADDLGKALLEPAEAEVLSVGGMLSLKIHLSNLWGNDKVSYSERIRWVDENLPQIRESVDCPLGCPWWHAADKPLLFLGAAQNLLTGLTGEPVRAIVQMDGSCNGIQHLSAMNRDESGGACVNLTNVPVDSPPSDIYTQVLTLVKSHLENDPEIAELWREHCDRKMIKRNVMTTPYSVTDRGMRDQIREEVKKRKIRDKTLLDSCNKISGAVVQQRGSLLCHSMEVMEYLKTLAKACNLKEAPIVWTTPLGFKVIQYYNKTNVRSIFCITGTRTVRLSASYGSDGINKLKQTLGIAPNFVHSMDACHLAMTVLKAHEKGIRTFAMIHDSYGTTPNQAALLGTVLRVEFFNLYSQDILLKTVEDMVAKMPGALFPRPPQKGALVLSEVIHSPYFFSGPTISNMVQISNTIGDIQNGSTRG